MWKEFKILQKSYFMKCSFSADKKVTLILYDHQEFQSWYETLEFDEVKRKVKVETRQYIK